MTNDPDEASAFYGSVVGWKVHRFPPAGGAPADYRLLEAPDGQHVGGMLGLPDGAPMPPGWFGYVGVEDVDATVAAIEAAGGTVHMPALTIDKVGRLAMVGDPQGAIFYVMRGASDGTSGAFAPDTPGHAVWNELTAADQDAALAFYGAQFGWAKTGAMPMGEMGDYSFFSLGDLPLGAMMNRQAPDERPRWRTYFQVGDIDAAGDAIAIGGGTILHGPSQIPPGDFIIIAIDPQGAEFGVVGKRIA